MSARALVIALSLVFQFTGPAAFRLAAPAEVTLDSDAVRSFAASFPVQFELTVQSVVARARRPGVASLRLLAESGVTRHCCQVLQEHEPTFDPLGRWLRLARAQFGGELPA